LTSCKSEAPAAKKEEAKKEEAKKKKAKTPEADKQKPAEPDEAARAVDEAGDSPVETAGQADKTAEGVKASEKPAEEKAEKKADEARPEGEPALAEAKAEEKKEEVMSGSRKLKLKAKKRPKLREKGLAEAAARVAPGAPPPGDRDDAGPPAAGKDYPGFEDYARIVENEFKKTLDNPLSTFSIDVDTASYANTRRFLNDGRLPPPDAVRIEELVNYFDYDYEPPMGEDPFAIETEISRSPWNRKNRLVLIGMQGKEIPKEKLPPSNLVFLLDVSGSMNRANKLPLLKQGFKLLARQLKKEDRVAITVYAGAAGLVLPSTPGNETEKIFAAFDRLRAGGSTAGAAGITLAYQVARENFIKGGNNRVILATDGDFNVGTSSNAELERLIEEKRKDGIFLTVLGFGSGNYKDSKMEQLADKGNGNYAYIDSLLEAKKVLVTELTGTLFTIAKDVKLQIEFNPTRVREYRLIGYENRVMAKEDFDDDKKDAGELGVGHTVTALYELVPETGKPGEGADLKYVKTKVKEGAAGSRELMTVKLRYKAPDGDVSKLIEHPVLDAGLVLEKTSDSFRFAASVAAFGMLLRGSKYAGDATFKLARELAVGAKGKDERGYRAEFIQLVEKAELLKVSLAPPEAREKEEPVTGAAGAASGACDRYSRCCLDYAAAMSDLQGVPPQSVASIRQACVQVKQLQGMGKNGEAVCGQALMAMQQAVEGSKAISGFNAPPSCLSAPPGK